MQKLAEGERTEGIEHDPLENQDPEYSYDYNVVPGYLQREKSISGDDKYHIKPHAKSVKAVENMIGMFKKKREEKEKGIAIEEGEEHEEEGHSHSS